VFLSAAGSVALAENAMTQHQYILWMANVCGDSLPTGATGDDLTTWARGKGMNPTGGWQLNAKLNKQVLAQTLVQLLNLAPRKGTFDAVRLLEREGIIIQSSGDTITVKNFANLIDSGLGRIAPPGLENHPLGGPPGRDDDDSPPSPTKRPVTPPSAGGSVPPGPPPAPPGQNNVNKSGH